MKLSLHVIKDLEYSDRFPCNIFKESSNLYFRLDWLLYLYSRVLFEVLSAQGIDLTGGAASLLFKQENDAEANKSKNSAWKLNSGSVSGSKGFNFYVAHYYICNVTNNFGSVTSPSEGWLVGWPVYGHNFLKGPEVTVPSLIQISTVAIHHPIPCFLFSWVPALQLRHRERVPQPRADRQASCQTQAARTWETLRFDWIRYLYRLI